MTYNCNAFCKKCMTRYHVKRNMMLSDDLLDYLLNKLRDVNYTGNIMIGSGESLLYPGIEKAILSTLSINDEITLRILSNGMLLNDKLPSAFFCPRCKWGVTLDAFSNECLKDVQIGVDIETVKDNLKRIVEKYGPDILYLNYTIYKQNLHEVIPFTEFAIKLGIKDIYLTEVMVYEHYEERMNRFRLPHDDETYRVINEARHLLAQNGINDYGYEFDRPCRKYACFNKGTASPIIDVDGEVSFCSGHEDEIIGNIRDLDIEEKWKRMADSLSIKTSDWCIKCHSRMLSNGNYSLPRTIDANKVVM